MRHASWLVACLLLGTEVAVAQEPKPLPRDVEAAWRDSGVEVGWMGPEKDGSYIGFSKELKDLDAALAVPAFRVGTAWRGEMLRKLPAPDQPFGLDFYFTTQRLDFWLTDLARFKQLTALRL